MKNILVLHRSYPDNNASHLTITEHKEEIGRIVKEPIKISTIDQLNTSKSIRETLFQMIKRADVVVADLSGLNPNILYELGYAHALSKPSILISDNKQKKPINLSEYFVINSDDSLSTFDFQKILINSVTKAINDPEKWISGSFNPHHIRPTVFISYSHNDAEFLNRIKVHLKPLEKQNLIDLWDDTKLKAGLEWKKEIEKALDVAGIALLLISADFLASDFITENELPPLLNNAQEKGTTILPVILKPCRFSREPNLSQFQAVNKPSEPVQSLSEYGREKLFEEIARQIELSIQ